MSIDLTKPIEVLQSVYGSQLVKLYRVEPNWLDKPQMLEACDAVFMPRHLAHERGFIYQFAEYGIEREKYEANFKEIEAYRRLFEAAPKMLALLKRIADEGVLMDCEPDVVTNAEGDIEPGELSNEITALLKEIEA